MVWVFAILVVLALGGIAVVAAGRGTLLEEAYDDRPDAVVPTDRALTGDDLREFVNNYRGLPYQDRIRTDTSAEQLQQKLEEVEARILAASERRQQRLAGIGNRSVSVLRIH